MNEVWLSTILYQLAINRNHIAKIVCFSNSVFLTKHIVTTGQNIFHHKQRHHNF